MPGALHNVRVLDYTWLGTGPITSLYLAQHGAEVIHVESDTSHDNLRHIGPYRNNVVDINASGMFEDNHTNKLGITLNMNHPDAREVAYRLVSICDVVVESYTPRTMPKWRMDYQHIRQVRPDIIMLSVPIYGQTGPYAMQLGHGVTTPALCGLHQMTGYPDRPPAEIGNPYTDWISPHFAVSFILSALEYRRRTGRGQYIDLAQYQASVHGTGIAVLEYAANRHDNGRLGNRHRYYAPQGVYRCKGEERWLALTVASDAQWSALARAMDSPAWASPSPEGRFATFRVRRQHHDELDRLIEEWTSQYKVEELMARLQAAGVPAGVVASNQDLHEDPQLLHRHHFWHVEHPVMGRVAHTSFAFRMSRTPLEVALPSPMLGQHNELVYKDILGLSEEEYVERLLAHALD